MLVIKSPQIWPKGAYSSGSLFFWYVVLSRSLAPFFFFFLSSSLLSGTARYSRLIIPTLPQPWNQPILQGVGVLLVIDSIRDQGLGTRCVQLECLCFLVISEDRARKYMYVYRQIHTLIYKYTYINTCIHIHVHIFMHIDICIHIVTIMSSHQHSSSNSSAQVLHCLSSFHIFRSLLPG